MRTKIVFLALALSGGGAVGCGQTSYFEVTVTLPATVDTCLQSMIFSCEVAVSGAASDSFTLPSDVCISPKQRQIGVFQYGTDKDSGNVAFHLDLFTGNRTVGPGSVSPTNPVGPIASGDGSASIKAGMRQQVTVPLVASPAFKCM
jgi:hypothetical protein